MSKLKTIFMFSGQGSQYYQMGQPLYEHNAVFRRWMDDLDAFGRRISGASIISLIYDPKRTRAQTFERTPLSGLAIFMVEYALAKTLEEAGTRADLTLGASLGTYAAAAISGAMTAEEAMTAIMQQSQVLERHCPPGGMLAIVAEPELFQTPELRTRSALAAVNFSGHFVIAGLDTDLAAIARFLDGRGISFQRVSVSFAFHSQWIDGAREPLQKCAESMSFRPLRTPLVCCAHARTFESLSPSFFWKVIRDPIEFSNTIAGLTRTGSYRFLDVGPSGTLAGFMRYLLPQGSASQVQRVLSPFGGELKALATAIAS